MKNRTSWKAGYHPSRNTEFKKRNIPWMTGRIGYWKDKKRSPETIEKIRLGHIGKKHSEDHKKKIGEARKKFYLTHDGPTKGMKHSKEARNNMRIAQLKYYSKNKSSNLGIIRSKETRLKIGLASKGRIVSIETRRKISESHKGKKAYQWKGGLTKVTYKIRHCFEYRQWRSDVFSRDSFTCQECDKAKCCLHAHHKKQFSKIIAEYKIKTLKEALKCEELWNLNNGVTLCRECHNEITRRVVKWKR